MEKKVILIAVMFLILGCFGYESTNGSKKAENFYKENKDVDFDMFKCFTILQWNQNRANYKEEYHIEFYPSCQLGSQKALRGKVKFENGKSIFRSEGLKEDDLPPQLLESFYQLQVSNLFYKNPDKLELTLYPDVRLLKSCGETKENYSSFDSCWHYKIIE